MYGMGNDANDLINDLTGFNFTEFTLGENGAKLNKLVNATLGGWKSHFEAKPGVGNIGDIKDAYELSNQINKNLNSLCQQGNYIILNIILLKIYLWDLSLLCCFGFGIQQNYFRH